MKASKFPREYIGFDLVEKKFLPEGELISLGITIAPDGLPSYQAMPKNDFVLLWFSGQKDKNNTKIYEGDICKMNVQNEFGSFFEALGIMRWVAHTSQFILTMGAQVGDQYFHVLDVERIGHELTHPDLLQAINEKAKKV
jgi:hypothetical protein